MLPVTTPSSWRHPWGHRGAEIPSHSSATRYSGPALLFHLGGVQQGPRRGSHTRHVHPPASPEDGLKGRQRETGGEDVKQGLITLEAGSGRIFMTKIKIHPSHQEPGKVQVELKKKKNQETSQPDDQMSELSDTISRWSDNSPHNNPSTSGYEF